MVMKNAAMLHGGCIKLAPDLLVFWNDKLIGRQYGEIPLENILDDPEDGLGIVYFVKNILKDMK